MPANDEVLFHSGTIFDGTSFLPEGTCVRVSGGRITAVGPLGQLLADYDALICPTFAVPALPASYNPGEPVSVNGKTSQDWLDVMMTIPFNIASRCPVLSVPSGLSRDGVPTGLSIVGPTYDDVTAFRIAAAHEERFPWLDAPQHRPGL